MPRSLEDNAAIGADYFASLLKNLQPLPSRIAVAVSGGPDSMALAFCLSRWGQSDVIALIVDHNLRPQSTSEAEQTKKILHDRGIHAEIWSWEHGDVASRLQERARKARYALLEEACHRHHLTVLFTAHHRDDQAETILMRLAKGSGIEGLSGITASSARNGIRVLRPLLGVSKQSLIATCQNAQIPFITDLSNDAPRFARGRLRAVMPLLEKEGMTSDNLLRLGRRAADANEALDYYANNLLEHAVFEKGGSIRFDRTFLSTAPRAIALRILSNLLRAIHDDGHPPEYDGLSDLLDFLKAAPHEATRTYHSSMMSLVRDEIIFMREPAAASAVTVLSPGSEVLWDNRWYVSAERGVPTCEIRALGNPSHDVVDALNPILRRLIPQGRIRASLPALWRDASLYAIPALDTAGLFHMRLKNSHFPVSLK